MESARCGVRRRHRGFGLGAARDDAGAGELRRQPLDLDDDLVEVAHVEIDEMIPEVLAVDSQAKRTLRGVLVPADVDRQARRQFDLQHIPQPIDMSRIIVEYAPDLCAGRKIPEIDGLHLWPLFVSVPPT